MLKRILSAALALALGAGYASAQIVYADPTSDFRGRVSVGIEKKLAKGLHAGLDEEVRFEDGLSAFARSMTTASLSYKFGKHLRAGAGYAFIYIPDDIRHRVYADLTGRFKAGSWTFSLRERLQCTHLTREFNEYQQPRNALALRSRLKVSYQLFSKPLEPYLAVELRNTLNGAKYTDASDPTTMTYSDMYADRVRTALGLQWKINKRGSIDFYGLFDACSRRDSDATKKGVLKSITIEPAYNFTVGVAYSFAL